MVRSTTANWENALVASSSGDNPTLQVKTFSGRTPRKSSTNVSHAEYQLKNFVLDERLKIGQVKEIHLTMRGLTPCKFCARTLTELRNALAETGRVSVTIELSDTTLHSDWSSISELMARLPHWNVEGQIKERKGRR